MCTPSSPWLRRAAVLAALVALITACGDAATGDEPTASPVPLGTWTGHVCDALAAWSGALSRTPAALQDPHAASDLLQSKRTLSAYLAGVVSSTGAMLDGVRAAGTPAVDGGDSVAADLAGGLAPLRTAYDQARTVVDSLPVTDRAAFDARLQQVGAIIARAGDQTRTSFDEIQRRYRRIALDRAFGSQPACRAIR